MINTDQLREYVIRPVLERMGVYSKAGENLLVLTAAAESRGGFYIHQLGNGPAVSIYQIEPATHDWLWLDYLRRDDKAGIHAGVAAFEIPGLYDDHNAWEMAGNLYYATGMCRTKYLTIPEALPDASDDYALAEYWKAYYNTYLGAGEVDEAVRLYREYGGA